MWTTKAAGGDKKLLKRIETALAKRWDDLQYTYSKLPQHMRAQFYTAMNMARDSPFGSFHNVINRHTYAYAIATLNASHVDYDFANSLKPDEFIRLTQEEFMRNVDETMHHLRPQFYGTGLVVGTTTPQGTPIWSPRSWKLIDEEMDMEQCEFYAWEPTEDPYSDDGFIWSQHFFAYNRKQKRMCYFYLRRVSALSTSLPVATSLMDRFMESQEISPNEASKKRAAYWFGTHDKQEDLLIDHGEVVDAEEEDYLSPCETMERADYWSGEDSDFEDLKEYNDALRYKNKTYVETESVMDDMDDMDDIDDMDDMDEMDEMEMVEV